MKIIFKEFVCPKLFLFNLFVMSQTHSALLYGSVIGVVRQQYPVPSTSVLSALLYGKSLTYHFSVLHGLPSFSSCLCTIYSRVAGQ